jgi:2-haloacid dehalogenase
MVRREALAFDVYGTLVDPLRVWQRLEQLMARDHARQVAETWRQKQLEYSFRLTAMERYEDFERVTRKALDHALALAGRELEEGDRELLMAQYGDLARFPDVRDGLARLSEAGYAMAVFSNGTPAMLTAILGACELRGYFSEVISVDEVKVYKPSPKTYRHAAERLGRPIEQVRLVSSNPFDVLGAGSAGMQTVWVDRGGAPFDALGPPPEMIVEGLTELADALEGLPRAG